MPLDESVLQALASASKFSTAQLNGISNSVLGTALTSISSESTSERQVQDMIAYARQYDLLRELAAAFLYTGADKPGLQNLLLGENMTTASSDQQGNNGTYIMLRMESKLDQALAEQVRIAAQVAEVARQQAQFDRRLYTIETVMQRPMPMPTIDRAMVFLMAIAMLVMFVYNIIGIRP